VSATAKTTLGFLEPAVEKLVTIELVGGRRVLVRLQDVYHVRTVLPTPSHLSSWGDEVGIFQYTESELAWEVLQRGRRCARRRLEGKQGGRHTTGV
jgi:hypothetical protein